MLSDIFRMVFVWWEEFSCWMGYHQWSVLKPRKVVRGYVRYECVGFRCGEFRYGPTE